FKTETLVQFFGGALNHRPSFEVLCNGPGTCVPIVVSALLLGILGIKKVIIVYVESICRVETLSLSGKILFHLSDYFIVQWPALKEKYPKSVYLGRIV
ncbi:PREDICTED: UDP-N-acetylglucosamine transferase subunit ALG14 homolog, partial [Galeopterus variegatus]|uniref:UDP-N-acetylglucosamine transferase subunit ALG14 n=1 Tax=Galeopterus variegatus TaxID=482537 RepID=A0ABM0S3H4_GALVR